jgi:phosphate transport system permease protein
MEKSDKISFQKKVDRANKRARFIITLGGYGIIISILLILFFLLFQSLPLTFGASLKKLFSWNLNQKNLRILLTGIDQYQELVYTLDESGEIRFFHLNDVVVIRRESFDLLENEMLLSVSKGVLGKELFAVGTNLGRILTAEIKMLPVYEGEGRKIVSNFRIIDEFQADSNQTAHIEKLSFRENDEGLAVWSWVNHFGKLNIRVVEPNEGEEFRYDLSANLGKEIITSITTSYDAKHLIAGTELGELLWFELSDIEEIVLKDNWKVYQKPVTYLSFLIGDNSLVIGSMSGKVEIWFPVRKQGNQFKFNPVHVFEPHPAAVTQIYASARNRSFITIDANGNVHLNYGSTGATQLTFERSDYPVQTAAIAPKSDGIVLIDQRDRISIYRLENEHPEATLLSLFGKVWYEGYPKPEFVWQSTGGADEFESKLSLIPLIFGTFKGTLYAMFFSIPLAILAAIYVSQFAPKRMARIVKPAVEIMAALPSVVIGFLAGLYFSPLFEKHLMTLFLFLVFMPVTFFLAIFILRLIPEHRRMQWRSGWEILFIIPYAILAFYLASILSHSLETILFTGDIKQWIYQVFNQPYDQRNSMVVGFALGFAVIPIIFTISEDALSNVPESLSSASLALGASRWQTVRRIVIPAAAGGIFAAIMLGFGRAIGETMIVLMATGNTPIIDLSPFNGFRAMSACIAVEIPEAPVGGTLYRVLFLTALLLFIFTFTINSISAIISDRLRKKYARF